MALETYTGYIPALVDTNPAGTDPATQGANHLRGIKLTLSQTFIGFTEPDVGVTKTASEINDLFSTTEAALKADKDEVIGIGQTWQDVTGSRALNTNYTNATGKPISVFVYQTGGGSALSISVDGVIAAAQFSNVPGGNTGASAIVPAGAVYRAESTAALNLWSELR